MATQTILHADGIRFGCRDCGGCCRSRGAYNYVYLSLHDRRRLARHLGLTTLQFTRRYAQKTHGWFHLKDPEGDCVFLEDGRCTVYDARPTQCRTWPFWPENMKPRVWHREIQPACPGIGRGRLYPAAQIERIMNEQRRYGG